MQYEVSQCIYGGGGVMQLWVAVFIHENNFWNE